jgi:hypothetical protein
MLSQVSELERLSDLIGFIYRGATEPSLWPEIVADASAWLGSPKGMLYTPLHGPEQGGIYFQHGLSDFFLELYKAKYQSVDMWTQGVVRQDLFKEGNVILGTDVVPHNTLVDVPPEKLDRSKLEPRSLLIAPKGRRRSDEEVQVHGGADRLFVAAGRQRHAGGRCVSSDRDL